MVFNATFNNISVIRVITKLPNTEQSSKGKGKTHKSTNRQNQSTTGKLGKPQWPDLVQAFPKKWWVESDFTAPNLPFPLRLKGYIMAVCFIGEGNRSTRRKPPTCNKSLTNFIT
jgi:hypothetical protein